MNAFAILAVNAHLQDLLDEAATRRAVSIKKPSLRVRIGSAASKAKIVLQSPADYSGSIIPNLQDYPYRG